MRLKLHCVKPNGFDGAESSSFDAPPGQVDQFQQMGMQQHQQSMGSSGQKQAQPMYGHYPDIDAAAYGVHYDNSRQQLDYAAVQQSVPVMDQSYQPQGVFPTPPMQASSQPGLSPEAYSTPDSFAQQQDLSELLGNLKVDEKGTGTLIWLIYGLRRS